MISLQPYSDHYYNALRKLRSHQSTVALLLANPAIHDKSEFDEWLARRLASPFFRIIDVNGDAAGYVQIVDIHRLSSYGFLGIALAPNFRGRGIGRSAMEATEAAAVEMELRKLVLNVSARNTPARRLYESLMYRLVGTLVQHHWDGNAYQDVCIYEKEINDKSNS